jgi:hypothetical protein
MCSLCAELISAACTGRPALSSVFVVLFLHKSFVYKQHFTPHAPGADSEHPTFVPLFLLRAFSSLVLCTAAKVSQAGLLATCLCKMLQVTVLALYTQQGDCQ